MVGFDHHFIGTRIATFPGKSRIPRDLQGWEIQHLRNNRIDKQSTRLPAVIGLPALILLVTFSGCVRSADPEKTALGNGFKAPFSHVVEPTPAVFEPSRILPASPELLTLGRTVYEKNCLACHGAEGGGDGDAAYLLYPKPRVFQDGKFALVSTWERVPTDSDLFRTISRGMPGSAMPSWHHLPEKDRWGLVHYVKSLSKQPLTFPDPQDPEKKEGTGKGIIRVPPEPPYDAKAKSRAAYLFKEACAACHGPTGRGDGVTKQIDDWGYRTRPRDLTRGIFKGQPTPEGIYRRITAGLPGTPMPMSNWAYGEDAWHLVHYVLEMSSEDQRGQAEMRRFEIPAIRVAKVPEHPDDGIWRQAPAAILHLMPLWWRDERPESLTVRALHDGDQIAFMLQWSDPTNDHSVIRPQDFRDAAAVELSPTNDPPFFAMGQAGQFVNIWMWKSEKQADMEPAFQDLDKIYPNIGIDSYPNLQKAPMEQPTRHALTLESDPTFITGWGAGNIVSDPTGRSSAENLLAQGFGTLKAMPMVEKNLEAKGVYGMGSYRIVLRRSLSATGARAVQLRPGGTVPVAFAVWDGSAGDRDGKKSVTIWQELRLAP